MAKIIPPQDVPALLALKYRKGLHFSNITNAIRKAYPWALPKMKSVGGNPSQFQRDQRERFKNCVKCWKKQPKNQGWNGTDPGARGREWWFDQAAPSGLWYYDYFIQQTMNYELLNEQAPWCPCGAVIFYDEQWQYTDAFSHLNEALDNDDVTIVNYPNILYGGVYLPYDVQSIAQLHSFLGEFQAEANALTQIDDSLPGISQLCPRFTGITKSYELTPSGNGFDTVGTRHKIYSNPANLSRARTKVGRCSKIQIEGYYEINGSPGPENGDYPTGPYGVKFSPLFACITASCKAKEGGARAQLRASILQPFTGGDYRRVVDWTLDNSGHFNYPPTEEPESLSPELITTDLLPGFFTMTLPIYGIGDLTKPGKEYTLEIEISLQTGYFTGQQGLDFSGNPPTGEMTSELKIYKYRLLHDE